MAETDDNRVEARLGVARSGMSATPERIQELQARVAKMDRAPAKPKEPFAAVLKRATPAAAPRGKAAKPEVKKTPRPGVRHPAENEAYGVTAGGAPIVLKG